MKTDAQDRPERSHELAQLLARTGLGERQAFARLYQHTSSRLFAVVLHIQRDRALAEELLREIFVAVWKPAAGFDAARSQPLTWLTAIARNRSIDSLRRAAAQPQTWVCSTADADEPVDEGPADDRPGPLDLLQQASEAARTGALRAGPERAAAPTRGAGLLRRAVACRGRRATAPAAGHGEELGAPRADEAEELPGARRARRPGASLT